MFPLQKSTSPFNGNATRTTGSRRVDRDKSSKRKSNLNRSLNSEEVPPEEFNDDVKNRRRRRRFFPPEVLEQAKESSRENSNRSDTNLTASYISQPSTSPRPHGERPPGVAPSFSEMGRYKPFAKRTITSSSPKEKPSSPRPFNPSPQDFNHEKSFARLYNKENLKTKDPVRTSASDNDDKSRHIAKRMEELTAFTKQTLARVERLATKSKESPKREVRRPLTSSPIKQIDKATSRTPRKSPVDKSVPSSILKKKSVEEPPIIIEPIASIPSSSGPVSILKRKVVVEPSTTKRKQGILKKRRSLDESAVLRHRSCSPDVAAKADSRSILKNQRRSSLEELTRTQSPETPLQSILKRKTSRTEDDDHSLNSPQGILKRRSGASSAGSTGSTPHVSITTAVILAAAGGAEIVLEPENESVKPILKKKSFSDEHSYSESSSEAPKPILKKKSSTETDDSEEKPKKPILKLPRTSVERDILDTGQESRHFASFKHAPSGEPECEVRPILKQSTSRDESPRPRLSFCGGSGSPEGETVRQRTSRRSHTICTDFNVRSLNIDTKEEDRLLRKPRPLSVHELVMSFEKTTSTGAIPKRTSLKRNSDRHRTQPVTSNELEESLNLVSATPQLTEDNQANRNNLSNASRSFDVHSLLDFTSSLENESHLNSFFSTSLHSAASPESTAYGKMSSDSAFQSLGDGLELEQYSKSLTRLYLHTHVLEELLSPSGLEFSDKLVSGIIPTSIYEVWLLNNQIDASISAQQCVVTSLNRTGSGDTFSNLSWLAQFESVEAVKAKAMEVLNQLTEADSQHCFQQWKSRMERCRDRQGKYIEGEKVATEDDNSSIDREATKTRGKLEPSKLELQMKAIAEEAKKIRLGKGNAGIERYKSRKTGTTERLPTRFSTQPVTFEEVQEASRINQNAEDELPELCTCFAIAKLPLFVFIFLLFYVLIDFPCSTPFFAAEGDEADPSNLSLSERIRMFDTGSGSGRATVSRRFRARFSTEVVSVETVESARRIFSKPNCSLGVLHFFFFFVHSSQGQGRFRSAV
ncbi:hypothetical protein NQ318_020622 [Aromia moschata]|uniref:Uncharacterized protein n=1 Tax=Aromia moschata TaxID=1265417 RepID=A0AAV8Z0N7_9CUCU|nr:hypothetical protein NQ318_020622 [Aromia moschata]